MANPQQERRERSELFERLWLYRWAYQRRSRYDSEPVLPLAMAVARPIWLPSERPVPRRGV